MSTQTISEGAQALSCYLMAKFLQEGKSGKRKYVLQVVQTVTFQTAFAFETNMVKHLWG